MFPPPNPQGTQKNHIIILGSRWILLLPEGREGVIGGTEGSPYLIIFVNKHKNFPIIIFNL